MKVTYEPTDVAMTFAPGVDEPDRWTIQFTNGPGIGRGGPSTTHADTGASSASRYTSIVESYVNIKFYGVSFILSGYTESTGGDITVELDNETLSATVPVNQNVLFALDNLEQRLHDFTITLNTNGTELGVDRFEYETGLPDTMVRVGSYAADNDIWVLQGDWEHRTVDTVGTEGGLKSLLSRDRGDEAALTGTLTGPSLLFLYGNTGPDYGLTEVSWTENTTVPSAEDPLKVYNGELPVELHGVLVYVGYVPAEGWNDWYIHNLDGRVNGRLVEFTRLDIWKIPPETAATNTNTHSSSTTETAGPESTSNSSGTPVAAIGGGVAAGIVALVAGILLFLFLRRRRRVQQEAAAASSLRPFPGNAESRTTGPSATYPSTTPSNPPLAARTSEKHVYINQKANAHTDTTDLSGTSSPPAVMRNLESKPAMRLFARDRERERDRKAGIVHSAESEVASSIGAGSVSGSGSGTGSSRGEGSAQQAPATVPDDPEALPPAYTPRGPLQS